MSDAQLWLLFAFCIIHLVLTVRALHRIETLRLRVRELEGQQFGVPFDEDETFWGAPRSTRYMS